MAKRTAGGPVETGEEMKVIPDKQATPSVLPGGQAPASSVPQSNPPSLADSAKQFRSPNFAAQAPSPSALTAKPSTPTEPEPAAKKAKEVEVAPPKKSKDVSVKSDNDALLDAMIMAYMKKAQEGGKYKEGYKKPEKSNGMIQMSFPSEKDAISFFKEQAAQPGQIMSIFNEKNELLAYSNGDGKLRHPTGKEFQEGDGFKPDPKITQDNFKMPRPGKDPEISAPVSTENKAKEVDPAAAQPLAKKASGEQSATAEGDEAAVRNDNDSSATL
ncbi:MAG: hypothetical protein Q8R79_06875 [Legionellaceae bacterium]|nr:hypothetical protein [Legionellaceae bacterium]